MYYTRHLPDIESINQIYNNLINRYCLSNHLRGVFFNYRQRFAICKVGDYGAIHYQGTRQLIRATALE